jgi:hypothetical protein
MMWDCTGEHVLFAFTKNRARVKLPKNIQDSTTCLAALKAPGIAPAASAPTLTTSRVPTGSARKAARLDDTGTMTHSSLCMAFSFASASL